MMRASRPRHLSADIKHCKASHVLAAVSEEAARCHLLQPRSARGPKSQLRSCARAVHVQGQDMK